MGKTGTIEIFDTTLRDGLQGEGISFSVRDKLAVSETLDELGVAWIEAGNPGSNPKDMDFFRLARGLGLRNAKICAFGSTRRKGLSPAEDPHIWSLLEAETGTIVIFGKSWDLHVTEILRADPHENLAMIAETIGFLRAEGRSVIYDAEHFFDGWLANPGYALETLRTAWEAGAGRLVLCDTNGGNFPETIAEGVRAAVKELEGRRGPVKGSEIYTDDGAAPPQSAPMPVIGIHAHNDSGLAVAASLAAVNAGCGHIQGTLLGFGERCGNTSLAALIPSLELKLKHPCLPPGRLEHLAEACRKLAEIANVSIPVNTPYVGACAFSHKAGMHADGILKIRHSFEHIDPALVGNGRRFLMSEVVGRSAIAERVRKIYPSITKDHPVTAILAARLKSLEAEGWAFDGADGSFELLARRELGLYTSFFRIEAYRVVSEHPTGAAIACSHAWIKVFVDGEYEIAAAEGKGPVNALDGALRRALTRFYPELVEVRLSDYKVRVIDGKDATEAKVRVLIETTDGQTSWSTAGVSADIIDASRAALVDSIEYKLIKDR
ncbi:MAG: citramalate synthase [Treponema sp.]|jgi:2-isopropylmalate synthase|nr:citramalate synthase [Treponema sp.]